MGDVVTLIKDVGFPIAVTVFVLVRLNGKFDRLARSLDRLNDRLAFVLRVEDPEPTRER